MRKLFKNILPVAIHHSMIRLKLFFTGQYVIRSYAQDGEDIILQKIFPDRNSGVYIDVGAHHPKRFSNTYLLYKIGWKGINIDAMPGSMRLFNKQRPRDINIEAAVSDKKETLVYYIFNEPALNGFSTDISLERNRTEQFKIVGKLNIDTRRLEDILDEHELFKEKVIDFLTIDVEGLDFNVLKSNNWKKYQPRVIIIEMLGLSIEKVIESEMYNYLSEMKYVLFAKTYHSAFFVSK